MNTPSNEPRRITEVDPPVFPCWLWCPQEHSWSHATHTQGEIAERFTCGWFPFTHWLPDQPTAPTCVPEPRTPDDLRAELAAAKAEVVQRTKAGKWADEHLADLRRQLAETREELAGVREYQDACAKALYLQLGIDGTDGEIRFKWISLEVGKLRAQFTAEAEKDRERIDHLEKLWTCHGNGQIVMGHWFANPTGSFRDAIDDDKARTAT